MVALAPPMGTCPPTAQAVGGQGNESAFKADKRRLYASVPSGHDCIAPDRPLGSCLQHRGPNAFQPRRVRIKFLHKLRLGFLATLNVGKILFLCLM
eukprot:SAG11_NODE_4623_length_1830_cov_3.566147_1_plen_95_part_10